MAGLDPAVIGNCTIASVISPTGRRVLFCFSRLDADPVFNALLGGTAPELGYPDACLHGRSVTQQQRYLPNTAVLATVLTYAAGGKARVLAFCPRLRRYGRMFPPPTLVRRIEPLAERRRITVALRSSFEYGTTTPGVSFGSNHMCFFGPDRVLCVTTDIPLSYLGHEAGFALDRPINLFVGADETVPEALEMLARQFLDETAGYWRDWVCNLNAPFDWQEAVIRAAITPKLCSYDDTGAIVAALTTSIPESPGSGRTWDYPYCWVRDTYFTVGAVNRLSTTHSMEAFLRFILDVVQRKGDAELAPLYPIASIEKHLLRNGFVMRYVKEDDFGKPDSAFLVWTFWYIDALASVGRCDESLALFENVLAQRNHLGLLLEDITPATGVLWGNFPQTYSQVGLIFAAMRLSRSWEEGMWRAS